MQSIATTYFCDMWNDHNCQAKCLKRILILLTQKSTFLTRMYNQQVQNKSVYSGYIKRMFEMFENVHST